MYNLKQLKDSEMAANFSALHFEVLLSLVAVMIEMQ